MEQHISAAPFCFLFIRLVYSIINQYFTIVISWCYNHGVRQKEFGVKEIRSFKFLTALICASVLFYSDILPAGITAYADDKNDSQGNSSIIIDREIDEDPEDQILESEQPSKKVIRLSAITDADDPLAPINSWFGVKESNTATIKFLKNKKKKRLEYRALAKQKMFGYDTFQGACSSGKYNYYILYNRVKEKCKIIKVRNSDKKVIKVSKPLPLDHGNDITFDSKRKRIICVHYGRHPRRLSIINTKKLTITKSVDVKVPIGLYGASDEFIKSIKGMTGIGYDSWADEFIVSIKGARHYMALSPSFEPLRIIKVPEHDPYMKQGMTVKAGFIIRSFSAYNRTYNQNILFIYDVAGNYVKSVKLGRGYEIESIFFIGKKLYANTYTAYWKAKYKKAKKLVNGKTIKVKVKYYALARDNNILRIKNY